MFSLFKGLFSNKEQEIIESVDDNKLVIILPLNARQYLKRIFKEEWNKDKNIDYNAIQEIEVGDEISYYPNNRYSPELKFFKTKNFMGDGLISVISSEILFEVFWMSYNSPWKMRVISFGKVIEKNKNSIKVQFIFNANNYDDKIKADFDKFKATLNRKYKPKSDCVISCQLIRKITKKDINSLKMLFSYDDESIMNYIKNESIKKNILRKPVSFCSVMFDVQGEDVLVKDSFIPPVWLVRAVNSNVELDIEFKRLGKRDLSDWREDEWFYRFTFSPHKELS